MIREPSFQKLTGSLFVFCLTLLCYLVTLPNSITLEDAGLFQMICHNGGVGHPPGYPLFVITCQKFVALPFFDTSVFAANLISALYASGACVVLFLLARKLLVDDLISAAVAVCFGLSMTFWSQAVIVEVYSLAVLMFLSCAFFAIRFSESGSFRDLVWLALLFGLSLSNHWPLHILATPALVALLSPRLSEMLEILRQPLKLALLILAGCVGLLPYLSLLQEAPAFSIYGAVENLEEFLRYVSRAAYSDHSELAQWSDRINYQVWLLTQSLRELHPILGCLALAGVYRSFIVQRVSVCVALILTYISGTTLLNLLLGFEFNEFRVAIFTPYPVVAYLALAIWMGLGLQWLVYSFSGLASWLRLVLPLVACSLTMINSYPSIATLQNDVAEQYGKMVLQQVPKDAVLFVEGDSGVGLIGYLHYVRGDRSDIELRSWNNLVFPNRLVSPTAPRAYQNKVRQEFIASSDKAIFSTSHGGNAQNRGLVFQHNVPPGFRCDGDTHDFIEYLTQIDQGGMLRNGHEQDLLFQLLAVFTRQHLGLQLFGDPGLSEETRVLNLLQTTLPGMFVTLEVMSQIVDDEAGKARLRDIGDEAVRSVSPLASRKLKGLLAAYRGQIEMQGEADLQGARQLLEYSVEVYPHSENPGVCLLHSTYRRLGLQSNLDQLIKKPEAVICE